MSGVRFIIGFITMGVIVPITLFFLLDLKTPAQIFTVAATTFLAWGAADLLAQILGRPRLKDRSPTHAFREDLDRRSND